MSTTHRKNYKWLSWLVFVISPVLCGVVFFVVPVRLNGDFIGFGVRVDKECGTVVSPAFGEVAPGEFLTSTATVTNGNNQLTAKEVQALAHLECSDRLAVLRLVGVVSFVVAAIALLVHLWRGWVRRRSGIER